MNMQDNIGSAEPEIKLISILKIWFLRLNAINDVIYSNLRQNDQSVICRNINAMYTVDNWYFNPDGINIYLFKPSR